MITLVTFLFLSTIIYHASRTCQISLIKKNSVKKVLPRRFFITIVDDSFSLKASSTSLVQSLYGGNLWHFPSYSFMYAFKTCRCCCCYMYPLNNVGRKSLKSSLNDSATQMSICNPPQDFNAKGESARTTRFHFKTKEFILTRFSTLAILPHQQFLLFQRTRLRQLSVSKSKKRTC